MRPNESPTIIKLPSQRDRLIREINMLCADMPTPLLHSVRDLLEAYSGRTPRTRGSAGTDP